jgi:hypothetical protein
VHLEDRALLATFLVTTVADGGPGSLRQAILESNASSGTSTIEFSIPGQGVRTIAPASPLPSMTGAVVIDGSTQPGYDGSPLIRLSGSNTGLTLYGPSISVHGVELGALAIDASGDERLTAQVTSEGLATDLSLIDSSGQVVVQSAAALATSPGPSVDEHVTPGTYTLVVAVTSGSGDDTLTAALTPASVPFEPITINQGSHYGPMVFGDFNGDGIEDLAAPDGVHLGLGDGTFEPPAGLGITPSVSENITAARVYENITAMVTGDFNGDGKLDLAIAYSGIETNTSGGVYVLMGNGNGTFQTPVFYPVGENPASLAVGDFTGDGYLDIAVADKGATLGAPYSEGGVSILMNKGNGTFQPFKELMQSQAAPQAIVSGYFLGTDQLDLAVADKATDSVSIVSVNRFGVPVLAEPPLPVGNTPYSIVAGNFTGDGATDLAVANFVDNTISVLLNEGDGTFEPAVNYSVDGLGPQSLIAADFSGDGKLDLAVVDTSSDSVSLLAGNGDGTFQAAQQTLLAYPPSAIATADLNGDGEPDLAVASGGQSVSILLNLGNGTFQTQQALTGTQPVGEATGDFTGDGYTDVATVNKLSDDISILLGNGDGTFTLGGEITLEMSPGVDLSPAAIVADDFNGDGRLDLAVTGSLVATNGQSFANGGGEVAILLGNGDGTFQAPAYYGVGVDPVALVAGDFNGRGTFDLAVANSGSNNVSILVGHGDGTFSVSKRPYSVGSSPDSIVTADFNGDGDLDLAVTNLLGGSVSILLGNGDGTFQPAFPVFFGADRPESLAVGDFNGDGRVDLAVANSGSHSLSILLGNGDGTFQPAPSIGLDFAPVALVAAKLDEEGSTDLAAAGTNSSDGFNLAILLGNGDGTFQLGAQYAVGVNPKALVATDLIGDGQLDLVDADASTNDVNLLLGDGNGTFVDASQVAGTRYDTPIVADVNGDGTDDVLVIDAAGNILYRQGVPQQPGTFAPPVPFDFGAPVQDMAWVPDTAIGPLLATIVAGENAIILYSFRQGSFIEVGSLAVGEHPAQIIAADLSDDGWDDLVVRDAVSGNISVYFNLGDDPQSGPLFIGPRLPVNYLFTLAGTLSTNIGASDVEAVDTTGDGRLDLVVSNKLTGQVSVLLDRGNDLFAAAVPYRASTGISQVDPESLAGLATLDGTANSAAGVLTAGAPDDLVTANPGSNSLDILVGTGQGPFSAPTTIQTDGPPEVVRMADFTGDGIDDLAVLTASGLEVFIGNGKGGFLSPVTYAVGPNSTGLTVADVNHDGTLDLLIGDSYGDVLVLLGNGNGTFQPYHQADQGIALAVADLTGDGSEDVIYADQKLDRVAVNYGAGTSKVLADHLLEPGALALADLSGNGVLDLVVANSGGNDVLIYPGLGNGQFGPEINGGHGYFVGTNPVGISVADLTGALPDLVVADKGSNQVSILLNKSTEGGPISFSAGPRLNSGGSGPVSTVVGNFTRGAYPDIAVTNSGSNDVALLNGVGQGFFNDQNPTIYHVGTDPVNSFYGDFTGEPDLVTVNAGSNDLTLIANFNGPDPVTSSIASGGLDPSAAFAFDTANGFEDLVVGDSGDANLALFSGGTAGLSLTSIVSEPSLPDLTAMAFLAATGGQVQFYAATAGLESAAFITLNLTVGTLNVSTTTVLQLVPLSDSSLPLVATILTLSIALPGDDSAIVTTDEEGATEEAESAGTAGSAGQGALPDYADFVANPDEPAVPNVLGQSAEPGRAAASSSWKVYFLRLDDFSRDVVEKPDDPTGRGNAPGDGASTAPADLEIPKQTPATSSMPPSRVLDNVRMGHRSQGISDTSAIVANPPNDVALERDRDGSRQPNIVTRPDETRPFRRDWRLQAPSHPTIASGSGNASSGPVRYSSSAPVIAGSASVLFAISITRRTLSAGYGERRGKPRVSRFARLTVRQTDEHRKTVFGKRLGISVDY